MFTATLNRSLTSYIKAIIGAEYILRWLPIGTHDWNKFLKPEELENYLIKEKLINYEPDMIISYTGVNDSGGYSREIIFDEVIDDGIQNELKFGSYPWYRTPFVINNLIKQNNLENNNDFSVLSTQDIQEFSESFRKNWSQSCQFLSDNQITSMIILQPSLITKNTLSNFEKTIEIDTEYREEIIDNYAKELELINTQCNYTFDFRDILDDTYETTYYDNVHMNDLGNRIVAEKIFEKIYPIVLGEINN